MVKEKDKMKNEYTDLKNDTKITEYTQRGKLDMFNVENRSFYC